MANSGFITHSKMENIVTKVLNNAGIPAAWNGTIHRIDVDKIIEFTYGIDFEVRDLSSYEKGNSKVYAAICPEKKVIYFNESEVKFLEQKPGVGNFTKAHELGHWVLHCNHHAEHENALFSESTIYCRGINGSNRDPREIQADMFAAALLMPIDIITGAINSIKTERDINFPDLYNLCREFEVSITALTLRAESLGLLVVKDKKVYSDKAEAEGEAKLF